MAKANVEYTLWVEYPEELYFTDDLDEKINEVAGVESDGSGMGFGFRDLSFTFPSEKLARAAEKRIRKVNSKIGTSVAEYSY